MSALLFATLHDRIIEMLRARVRNGEITERRLAKLTGISQPHMHNVLKRNKFLSYELADTILQHLNISLWDLIRAEEPPRATAGTPQILLPLLRGLLGPGHSAPFAVPDPEFYPILALPFLKGLPAIPAVRLARDPEMEPLYKEGEVVLLDETAEARSDVQPLDYYVVDTPEGLRVRGVRRRGRIVHLVAEVNKDRPGRWPGFAVGNASLPDLITARVIWLRS